MIRSLVDILSWSKSAPGWPLLMTMLALSGAGLMLALRRRALMRRIAGAALWLAIIMVGARAFRDPAPAQMPFAALRGDSSTLLIVSGLCLAGLFAWLTAGAAAIEEERRRWISPLVFILLAGAVGAATASDLVVLLTWQSAIGASVVALVLLTAAPGEANCARSLLTIEGIGLIGSCIALILLGFGASTLAPAAMAAGCAVLLLTFVMRLLGFIAALSVIARRAAPVLAIELALMSIAMPSVLLSSIAVLEKYRSGLPFAFVFALELFAGALLVAGPIAAIGARGRAVRLAAIAATLIGLGLFGACEAVGTSLLLVLTWLGPVPAFLAATSVAGRIDRGGIDVVPRLLTPQQDVVALLAALSCFALVGLPPFAGFWPRYALIVRAFAHADYGVGLVTIASSLILGFALARRAHEPAHAPATGDRRNSAPPIALPELLLLGVMSGLTLAGGLFPAPFIGPDQTASAAPAPLVLQTTESR